MSKNKPPRPDPVPPPGNSSVTPQKDQSKTLEELIQEKAPEVLDAIPVGERPKLAKVVIEQTRISYRSGILPEPRELAAYNAIIPNGADRIMKMSEAQSAHRMELEKTVIGSQQKQSGRGQIFGLIIGLTGLALSTYAAINGQPTFGSIIGGTTLVSLVGVFVYSKEKQKAELDSKSRQMQADQTAPNSKSGRK